jgi:tetratricopeptide (TPR) repeat protein
VIRNARARLVASWATLLPLVLTSTAFADVDSIAKVQSDVNAAERELPGIESAVARAKAVHPTAEQRLANAELLYRSKDYPRAITVLSEIMEEFPDTPSYPDALWMRGETQYLAKDYLAARRDYKNLVDRASEMRFRSYLGKALARLVDVSLRLNDMQGLDEVFAKLNQVPPSLVDSALHYAKGKAQYFRKNYGDAKSELGLVGKDSGYAHQARYFEGMVEMRLAVAARPADAKTPANFNAAIEAFKRGTELAPDTEEHRHVIDLSWMAIGRLFYEMEKYTQAADAYSRVGRESPEFDTMLYELAWVYVRLGDPQRAERALEVLAIADPTSAVLGEGTLLRADLLLRSGSFRKALALYETVKEKYDPLRVRVDSFLDSTQDPSVYYEKLSQQQLDVLDQRDQLPPIALKWAREGEDGPMAFATSSMSRNAER